MEFMRGYRNRKTSNGLFTQVLPGISTHQHRAAPSSFSSPADPVLCCQALPQLRAASGIICLCLALSPLLLFCWNGLSPCGTWCSIRCSWDSCAFHCPKYTSLEESHLSRELNSKPCLYFQSSVKKAKRCWPALFRVYPWDLHYQ